MQSYPELFEDASEKKESKDDDEPIPEEEKGKEPSQDEKKEDEPLKEETKVEESPSSGVEKWLKDSLLPQAVAFVNTFLSRNYF